jgi:hypothetical protein
MLNKKFIRFIYKYFLQNDYMSVSLVNQITLDCLLNKEMINKHLKNKKTKTENKEERKFYRKRTYNLFKELITGNVPNDLLPDVKYAYDNFVNASIHYFKTIDNNDLRQEEYKDADFLLEECSKEFSEKPLANPSKEEADKLMLRSIKIDMPTLDKYVKRTTTKQKEEIILPKQKDIDLKNPELKTKGLKKKNITNKYEDNIKETKDNEKNK